MVANLCCVVARMVANFELKGRKWVNTKFDEYFRTLNMEITCPASEAYSLVNSMNESRNMCDGENCVEECVYQLQISAENHVEDIGEICKLLDELIEINDERQVKINNMRKSLSWTSFFFS